MERVILFGSEEANFGLMRNTLQGHGRFFVAIGALIYLLIRTTNAGLMDGNYSYPIFLQKLFLVSLLFVLFGALERTRRSEVKLTV